MVIPSINTGVEYDLQKFHLESVTWHASRFWIELSDWAGEVESSGDHVDTAFQRFLDIMRGEIPLALRNALSADVTHIMMGMSSETYWGGVEGSQKFEQSIREHIGDMGLTVGNEAASRALECFGVKTLSVVSPHPPIGEVNVKRYFDEVGFKVKKVKGMNRPTATAIAQTPISEVLQAVREVDGDDVDTIVQFGTNLSTLDLFPTLEHQLQKPLIPVNVANLWHALRACGIEDQVIGRGRLLEEF